MKWNWGKLADISPEHRGRVYCTLIGLVIGILMLIIGFWRTMLLGLFVVAGFFVGQVIDTNPKIRNMIRDFFNPNDNYYD